MLERNYKKNELHLIFIFVAICFLSFGNFAAEIVGYDSIVRSDNFPLQQGAVLLLWTLLGMVLIFNMEKFNLTVTVGVGLYFGLITYYCLSVLWSGDNYSFAKSISLFLVTSVVYLVANSLRSDYIYFMVGVSAALLILLSVIAVVLFPSVGVLDTWMHFGQWRGVFQTKQDLGFMAAIFLLLLFTTLRAGSRPRDKVVWFCSLFFCFVCIFMSGSRGAAISAIFAIVLIRLVVLHKSLRFFLIIPPLAFVSFGFFTVYWFYAQATPVFILSGQEIDITERTYIWQFALSQMEGREFFGYGLNFFWSQDSVFNKFFGEFSWFLDNFHSGYVSLFVEGGIVGCFVFLVCLIRIFYVYCSLSSKSSFVRCGDETMLCLAIFAVLLLMNVTETYLLRSTSFYQVIFSYAFFRLERIYKLESESSSGV